MQDIVEMDYANDIVFLANISVQAESLLRSLQWTAGCVGLHVYAEKTECTYFNQRGDISTLNCDSLILVDKFTCLGSSVSAENDIDTWLGKSWTGIDSQKEVKPVR